MSLPQELKVHYRWGEWQEGWITCRLEVTGSCCHGGVWHRGFSGVMSVPPRDTLLGATGENSHKNLGSRVWAQESPVHFQKRLSPSERRSREALIPAGPGMIQKWGGGRGNFPDTVDSRMVSPGSHGVNKEEGRNRVGSKLIQVKKPKKTKPKTSKEKREKVCWERGRA